MRRHRFPPQPFAAPSVLFNGLALQTCWDQVAGKFSDKQTFRESRAGELGRETCPSESHSARPEQSGSKHAVYTE